MHGYDIGTGSTLSNHPPTPRTPSSPSNTCHQKEGLQGGGLFTRHHCISSIATSSTVPPKPKVGMLNGVCSVLPKVKVGEKMGSSFF